MVASLAAIASIMSCFGGTYPKPHEVVRMSAEGHTTSPITTISPSATIPEQEPLELMDSRLTEDALASLDEKQKQATTFFACLVFLVMGTIFFDYVKESIVEYVEESQLAPVVDAMFGELTVLGFIGLVSFVLEKLHVFTYISEQVFDQEIVDEGTNIKGQEEWQKKVPEIFESLHMLLFLVMVIFIFEVMLTIYYAKRIQDKWIVTEKICSQPTQLAAVMQGWHPRDHTVTKDAVEAMKSADLDPSQLDFMMDYLSLRVEFISPRENDRLRLGSDFDFSDYMGHVMGIVLSGIVNVSVIEWLALLAVFTGFYFALLILHSDQNLLAIVLAIFVYSIAFMLFSLDRKLRSVMKQLTCRPKARDYLSKQLKAMEDAMEKNRLAHLQKTPRDGSAVDEDEFKKDEQAVEVAPEEEAAADEEPPKEEEEANAGEEAPAEAEAEVEAEAEAEAATEKAAPDESTPLVAENEWVPLYLKQEPVTQRTCFAEMILGQLPNKHEQLFWFDRMGPRYNRTFIQVVLVLMAIYIPIQFHYVTTFGLETTLASSNPNHMDIIFYVLYLFVTLLPIGFIYYEIMEVLSVQFLVCNVEMMRRRELIQKCKMSQRTAKVVRILQIINSLRQKAEVMRAASEAASSKADPEAQQAEMDPKRRKELEDIFDYFDADGNGALDASELSMFLGSLGQPGNLLELADSLVDALDNDGNGTVEKDEFVLWMIKSEQHSTVQEKIPEIAHKMFKLFDQDGDGFMTQDEFAAKMSAFGIKLTEEELALLMRELDEDGTGRIDENDFRLMLERHDFDDDSSSHAHH